MSSTAIGFIGLGVFVILILCRMPIAFAMAFVGFLGFWHVSGLKGALAILGQVPYHTAVFYEYIVVPLFILMGMFAYNSGISRSLFEASYKWLGHVKGGLAISAIGACSLFAAICGSSMPTAAAMGLIALPEMRRYGYDPGLATGSLAAGGTLGVLIPPSIGFVIYGIITEQSIGRLLIAGILPGLLLSGLFMLTVYIQCLFSPALGPAGPKTALREKVRSLKGVLETLTMFVVCIGGLYLGIFTPVEAAGIGALGTFIIGLIKRKLALRDIVASIVETGKITAMIFAIIIGAFIFGYFMSVSRLPLTIAQALTQGGMSRYTVLAGVLFIYVFIGGLMDFLSMVILILPIIFPLITGLGFDPIWFGVITVVMLELGQITPPVAINVYTIHGVAKDISIGTIFKGIFPFCLAIIALIFILILFPQIALFLPDKMFAIK